MISIDSSILAAILIFLAVVFSLNYILLHPLGRMLEERAARTTGIVASSKESVDRSRELFDQYQATIKQGRAEGYRLLEQARVEAQKFRAEALERARRETDQRIQASRADLAAQVSESKTQLAGEVEDIARGIAASILGRSV